LGIFEHRKKVIKLKKDVKIIILIVLDTLRADHLSCYGYSLPTSPTIDKFAKEATLYFHAFSTGSYTVPVHASLMTGKYPSNHSLFFQQTDGRLNISREITLAEILRTRHFKTGAFVSSYVLRKELELGSGFDVYDDKMTRHETNRPESLIRDGHETNKVFFDFFERNPSDKCFYFLHYFDIHGPYVKDIEFNSFPLTAYGNTPQILKKVPDGFPMGIPEYQLLNVKKDKSGNIIDYEKDRRVYLAQYDKGIRYCDSVVGEVLDYLKSKGLYENAMIILTGDHGEALGENDIYFFHGLTVSLEQIKIPLIIKYPYFYKGGLVFESPVSHVDLLPTILDWVGMDRKCFSFDGVNLNGDEENIQNRWILAENQWQRAIVRGRYLLLTEKKVTHSIPGYYYPQVKQLKMEAFYDYVSDPMCNYNLIEVSPEVKEFLIFNSFFVSFVDPKEETIAERDETLQFSIKQMKMAKSIADSILNSWSWKITRPLRWSYAKTIKLTEKIKQVKILLKKFRRRDY
jgi:arylsulfatase